MELIGIGFMLGIVCSVVMIGGGVVYAERMVNRKQRGTDNTRVRDTGVDRLDGSDNRYTQEIEELADKMKVRLYE